MNILYVGKMWRGTTSRHRFEAMQRAGYHVVPISADPILECKGGIGYRIIVKLDGVFDSAGVNRKILKAIQQAAYDMVWIDKGLKVSPRTLQRVKRRLPEVRLISYSPDDMMNPNNQTKRYLDCIPLFDEHVTTKSFNVEELKSLGAREVRFVPNAFEPSIHYPDPGLQGEYRYDVSFVGAWERERADFLEQLAADGLPVVWHCPGWPVREDRPKHVQVKTGQLRDRAYAEVLQQTKINLAFLRKENRDLQTQRTMEIPACGGFMLAEYSSEHAQLFEEGAQAAFFRHYEECKERILYYLDHEEEREQVRKAGQELVWQHYSNEQMIRSVVEEYT